MINVQQEDFNMAYEYGRLRDLSKNTGAIVTFTGLVRELYALSDKDSSIACLELEHYPGMTEKSLQSIADEACQRWDIAAYRIIHRVGKLKPGDQIVFIAVASAHRQEAFLAAEFVMDYLKSKAPFWKKQLNEKGEHWVASRTIDKKALLRWDLKS